MKNYKDGIAYEMSPAEETAYLRSQEMPQGWAEFMEAVFEHLMEGRPAKLQAMQDVRLSVKAKYPKPPVT